MQHLKDSQRKIIEDTADHVRQLFIAEGTGHDWWHIRRVWHNARQIAVTEKADLFVVELGALLHDIADFKFHDGDETVGPRETRRWLEKLLVEETVIIKVCEIVKKISFKGAGVPDSMGSLEGDIVQDADRLDALGAIGIARAFAYGGSKGRLLYDPQENPQNHQSFEHYKRSTSSTLSHFHEKLLLLKDRMHTESARTLAEQRHQYMLGFIDQFLVEWDSRA
jgi:uncharacterized protein